MITSEWITLECDLYTTAYRGVASDARQDFLGLMVVVQQREVVRVGRDQQAVHALALQIENNWKRWRREHEKPERTGKRIAARLAIVA